MAGLVAVDATCDCDEISAAFDDGIGGPRTGKAAEREIHHSCKARQFSEVADPQLDQRGKVRYSCVLAYIPCSA